MIHRATRRPPISRFSTLLAWAVIASVPMLCASRAAQADGRAAPSAEERRAEFFARFEADREPPADAPSLGATPCVGGNAGGYPCDEVDLQAFLNLASIGGAGSANDIWGWTSGSREFALVGLSTGTAFVEITDPTNPVYLGRLPTQTSNSSWRDIKTYADHAFIVSEASGHGMQVFHLDDLLTVTTPPVTFGVSAHYSGFGNAHNIVINEDTGFAYAVGTSTCSGGLHMVNIQNPDSPVGAGCFSADGYTHDAQCVTYAGPDVAHQGQEICFNANEDTLTIVRVDNHASPQQLSRTGYAGSAYTHQGWLTADHRYFLIDDELDEQSFGHNTRTYVWDVQDLDSPTLVGNHTSTSPSIDHNMYTVGPYVYQANYRSGLRVLRIDDLAQAQLTQIGFFDVYPANDNPSFNGAWSVYPYFPSGNVVISGIEQGLFVVRPTNLCQTPATPTDLAAAGAGANRIDLSWTGSGTSGNTYSVERALGGCAGTFETIATGVTTESYSDTTASGTVTYGYRVREQDGTGACQSDYSTCVEASTTGACTAPPAFAGLDSATSAGTSACRVDLAWAAASPYCNGPARYSIYRSTDPDFIPSTANRIASSVAGTGYEDWTAPSLETVHYVVRAIDLSNGEEEGNTVKQSARASGPIADGTFTSGAEPGDPMPNTLVGTPPDGPDHHVGWETSTDQARTGTRSFFSTYSNDLCVQLEFGPIELTAGETSLLSFWTKWDIETGWDGGVVEASTNGTTWTQLNAAGFYPGAFNNSNSTDACGYANGTPAFTGLNQLGTWQSKSVSLGTYAGQNVYLRWQFSTDGVITETGWYVDDLEITHTQVPSACSSALLLFADHEEGDTSDWSSTVP